MQTSLEMLAGKGFTLSRPRAVPSRTSPPQLGQKVRLAGGLRPRIQVTASAAARSSSAVFGKIFNRKEELAALNLRFDDEPGDVLILLGPVNCGKSTLLEEVKKLRDAAQAVKGNAPTPILYLDCRDKDVSSPQGIANAIRDMISKDAGLEEWWESLPNFWAAGKVSVAGYQVKLADLFAPAPEKTPIASIIDSLTTFLEATRPLPDKPVIIIDEANAMMDWHDDPGHTQLKALLRFFVNTTKHKHLGHCVLASSESFVVDFLENEGLQTDHFVAHVIGDLSTSDQAKKYVESRMDCKKAPPTFFDTTDDGEQIDMWPRVYEVCGGNIGLLERCARYAKARRSWEAGLEEVSNGPEDKVQKGLWPGSFSTTGSRSPAAWTKEEYKIVLREIALAKEHKHAVSLQKLQDEVGEEAVRSMVEWNLVAVRPSSSWAKDVPKTVFTDLDDTKLVTMPSPVALYFVLKMHEAGKLDAAPPNDDK